MALRSTWSVVLAFFTCGILLSCVPLLAHGQDTCGMNDEICRTDNDIGNDDRHELVRLAQSTETGHALQHHTGAVAEGAQQCVHVDASNGNLAGGDCRSDTSTQTLFVDVTDGTTYAFKTAEVTVGSDTKLLTSDAAGEAYTWETSAADGNPVALQVFEKHGTPLGEAAGGWSQFTAPAQAVAGTNCLTWDGSGTAFGSTACVADAAGIEAPYAALFRIDLPASLADDPEVINVKGEKFKVFAEGGVSLLHFPRTAPISTAALVAVGEVQELEEAKVFERKLATKHPRCPPTYLRNLFVTGSLLGNLSTATFHARNRTTPFFMSLGVGKDAVWFADGHITSAAISAYTKKLGSSAKISITPEKNEAGSPHEIRLKLGPVTFTVTRPHIPKGKDWQYMNIRVDGLDLLDRDFDRIGGILGSDSLHDTAVGGKKTDKCLGAIRKAKHIKHKKGVSHVNLAARTIDEVAIDSDSD